MKLLGSTKQGVDEDKDGEDVPKVEPVEVVLVHCSLVNNNAEHNNCRSLIQWSMVYWSK